eukprot:EG_transcript_14372
MVASNPPAEPHWSYESAVEFDPPAAVDEHALLFPQHDTCRCSQSFGDVVVRPPQKGSFTFSFTVQGYNRDFLLFPGAPDTEADYFANFVCWDRSCLVLPRRATYTVTCKNGWLSLPTPAQKSKLVPRAQPAAKKPRLPLPKNGSAVQQLPDTLATAVKSRIRMTGDYVTFRVWCGAVLKLNPCQLPDDDPERRDWIRLNLRGILFDTTRHVLLKEQDTFFAALLGSGVWEPNEKGHYEIDRDPQYFPHILTYLYSGNLDIWTMTDDEIKELHREMDYYSIASQGKAADLHFERAAAEAAAVRMSPSRTTVKCILCTADVRLVLPPGVQSGSLLLSFTVAGNNSDFMLYSGDDFSQDPFFANFYVAHPKVIPVPALHRYVVKIAQGQVSFVRIGNPPPDEEPNRYAIKVTKPISDATM